MRCEAIIYGETEKVQCPRNAMWRVGLSTTRSKDHVACDLHISEFLNWQKTNVVVAFGIGDDDG